MKTTFRFAAICMALVLTCGCQARRPERNPAGFSLGESEESLILAFVIDLSGSYQQLMADDGKAYEFILQVLQRYSQAKVGTDDKVLITQISGTNRPLLWEGKPDQLRKDFPSSAAFRDYLVKHADPNGSRVHDGVRGAVEHVMRLPRVASGQARSLILVLSDMDDNASDAAASEQRLVEALAKYARLGGAIGMYYVEQTILDKWMKHLTDVGFANHRVEYGHPTVPSFD